MSGKGGVGKSLVAASLAKSLADQGRRTLLVELGGSRFFEFVYQKPLGFEPQEIAENLSLSLWEGEDCLKEYFQYLLRFSKVVDLFFDNRIMQALVHGAPGLKELALTGKITSREREVGPELPFDELVIDAYSTGHFKAMLAAPLAMAKAISFGPMGAQSRGIHEVLSSSVCEYLVVVTPEELPLTEGMELAQAIEDQVSIRPQIVRNKWWPEYEAVVAKSLPSAFGDQWQRQSRIQKNFDSDPYQARMTLPQIWSHDNRKKIELLSRIWGQTL